eukprot:TRINITY_DN2388_c0_g1_i6.p1 TRINITY_DN2388_c0_g1~~TRINITY_DN2388_c0_g1_i6.p1  ORF type:complete len:325 (+),score=94.24 TRINITY_DN2388_c0_g1_i6:144-1118(+)
MFAHIVVDQHWYRVLDPSISKDNFTMEELKTLVQRVAKIGESRWCAVASGIEGRTDTQCRSKWMEILKRGDGQSRLLMEIYRREKHLIKQSKKSHADVVEEDLREDSSCMIEEEEEEDDDDDDDDDVARSSISPDGGSDDGEDGSINEKHGEDTSLLVETTSPHKPNPWDAHPPLLRKPSWGSMKRFPPQLSAGGEATSHTTDEDIETPKTQSILHLPFDRRQLSSTTRPSKGSLAFLLNPEQEEPHIQKSTATPSAFRSFPVVQRPTKIPSKSPFVCNTVFLHHHRTTFHPKQITIRMQHCLPSSSSNNISPQPKETKDRSSH